MGGHLLDDVLLDLNWELRPVLDGWRTRNLTIVMNTESKERPAWLQPRTFCMIMYSAPAWFDAFAFHSYTAGTGTDVCDAMYCRVAT